MRAVLAGLGARSAVTAVEALAIGAAGCAFVALGLAGGLLLAVWA